MSEFEGFDVKRETFPTKEDAEALAALPDLIRASDLEAEPPEPAELGFEPDGMYQGFLIIPDAKPQDEAHAYLFDEATAPLGQVRSFYVTSKEGTPGLVPWAGAKPIWPHEMAWTQDLYHAQQTPEKIAFRAEYVKKMKGKEKA